MRTKALPVVLLALSLAIPAAASAQVGVGARIGTTGLGADLGIAISPKIMLRGGLGIQPINPSLTLSGIDFDVNLPGSFAQAGIELFPSGGGFRIGGGVLYKKDGISISGTFQDPQEINGRTYQPSEIGTITGTATSAKKYAPYAMMGFGKIASSGIGLFLDLGAAFVGESTLTVTANGQASQSQQFKNDLEAERASWEEDLNKYKIYPMVNRGLRIGFGG